MPKRSALRATQLHAHSAAYFSPVCAAFKQANGAANVATISASILPALYISHLPAYIATLLDAVRAAISRAHISAFYIAK